MIFSDERPTDTLISEISPLFQKHYDEVAHYKDIPLDPDWDIYRKAYETGCLRIFTVRDESRLLGYAFFLVRPNLHYKNSLQASQDIFFMSPEIRKGFTASRFLRWCDKQLKISGVQVVSHHSKCAADFGPILMRMGYEAVDIIYVKRLDQWEAD